MRRDGMAAGASIVSTLLAGYSGPVAVRLWDSRSTFGVPDGGCTVAFNQAWVLRDLILRHDVFRLAEAYLDGVLEIEGDLESIFDLGTHLAGLRPSWPMRLQLIRAALRLPIKGRRSRRPKGMEFKGTRDNSQHTIAHHYDVGNEFYGLWLDPEMVYSCAYFRGAEASLAEAQRDKLDYICRKLRLAPGQRLLDIGCGWGALARWAASHYGVEVYGITLSREQRTLALKRVHEDGLAQRVRIELKDYRDLRSDETYDRVVSVGMFEHIGVKNFPRYFGIVKRVLKPGGLFLNHGITSETGWQRTSLTRFMNRYIFPDGELARISDVCDAMERAGFEVVDVEGLRRHYALTLRRWVRALQDRRGEAIGASSDATYRLWCLYMAGCAHFFDEGDIGVYQVLAGHVRRPLPTPLRRDDLYRE